MRYRRRSVLTALAAGLAIALLPVAAEACGHDHRPGPGGHPGPGGGPAAGGRALEYTAVYVYKKLDPRRPASWENSGRQEIVLIRDGLGWVDRIDASLLPAEVCGDGWAVQEDQIRGLTKDQIPPVVERSSNTGVLKAPTLVAYRHRDLSKYVAVPECNPQIPVTPTPTPTPTDTQTPPPSEEPTPTPTPTPTETTPVVPEPTVPVVTPPAVTPPVVDAAPAAPAVPVVVAPSFAG